MILTILVTIFILYILCLIFCGFMLLRNEIVYKINIEAINKDEENYLPSYDRMLWTLNKWKYEHWIKGEQK